MWVGKFTMGLEKLKFDEIKSMLKNNMVSVCPSSYGCTSEVAKHSRHFPHAVKLPCASTKHDTFMLTMNQLLIVPHSIFLGS